MDAINCTRSDENLAALCSMYAAGNHIDTKGYRRHEVKRGLRNADGTGVLAGLTQIGNVLGYYVQDGERYPMPGQLFFRGINVEELVNGFMSEDRFGYEETVYLLLFGELPTEAQRQAFHDLMDEYREMPHRFTEDMILSAPSRDVMNKLARSVMAMYSYDPDPENNSYTEQMRKALHLIARCPTLVAHALAAKKHYYDNESGKLPARRAAGQSVHQRGGAAARPVHGAACRARRR